MLATVCFSVFVAVSFFNSLVADDINDAGFPNVGLVEEDLTFVFYSRARPEGYYISSRNLLDLKRIYGLFDTTHATVVLLHGWKDDYGADSNVYVRKAILDTVDANIIKVCWKTRSFEDYFDAKNAVPEVGRVTAGFLKRVYGELKYSFDRTILVGFSLGAHAAGNVGKNLPGKIPRIVGLDPAGPFIESTNVTFCLNPADAQYVAVIHTNAGLLGMRAAIGHSDFYPNGGGRRQPGCGLDVVGGCAHGRAWEFFAESVVNNRFVARKCSSYQAFQNNQCSGEVGLMGGLNLDVSLIGTFYLNTNDAAPYGQGR